jgi:hypothetical protein
LDGVKDDPSSNIQPGPGGMAGINGNIGAAGSFAAGFFATRAEQNKMLVIPAAGENLTFFEQPFT